MTQAEIHNHVLTEGYGIGDRVEFDKDRNVTRLIKTRKQVMIEQESGKQAEGK